MYHILFFCCCVFFPKPQIRSVPCMHVGGLQRWSQEKFISHLLSDLAQIPAQCLCLRCLWKQMSRSAYPMVFHLPCWFCCSPTPTFTKARQMHFHSNTNTAIDWDANTQINADLVLFCFIFMGFFSKKMSIHWGEW